MLVAISITVACCPPSAVAVEVKFENYKVIWVKSAQINLKLYQRDSIISKTGETNNGNLSTLSANYGRS